MGNKTRRHVGAIAALALGCGCAGVDSDVAAATHAWPLRPGCDPDAGIECDGDWAERCRPACDSAHCCSPQHGAFACEPPGPDGLCPAADLAVDPAPLAEGYRVEWGFFAAGDCALVEQCVDAPGWRRLLRFDTWTPNTGSADLYLGTPSASNPYYQYSLCHQHYHFTTYAAYALRGPHGQVAAGHKQAFCLEDVYRTPWDGQQAAMAGGTYTCRGPQGIQRGWQDVYLARQPCQWVDVTALAAGRYTLHVALNTAHVLAETDYGNNAVDVPIDLPPDDSAADPTQPCARPEHGLGRQCGFTREGAHACVPGAAVRVGCSAACGLGACVGNTILRVYEGERPGVDGGYRIQSVLVSNDDARCGGRSCRDSGDCCSLARFVCPASGRYTVLWGALDAGAAARCDVQVAP